MTAAARRISIEGLDPPADGTPKHFEFRREFFRSATSFGVVECVMFGSPDGPRGHQQTPSVQFQKLGSAVKMKEEFEWGGIAVAFTPASVIVSNSLLLQGDLSAERRIELLQLVKSIIPESGVDQTVLAVKHVPQHQSSESSVLDVLAPILLGVRDTSVLTLPSLVAANTVLSALQPRIAASLDCYLQYFPSVAVKEAVDSLLNAVSISDVRVGTVLQGFVVRSVANDKWIRVDVGINSVSPLEAPPMVLVEHATLGLLASKFAEGSRVRVRVTETPSQSTDGAVVLKGVILGEDRSSIAAKPGPTALASKLFRAIHAKASAAASAAVAEFSTERIAPLPSPLRYGTRLTVKVSSVDARGVWCDIPVLSGCPSFGQVQGLIVPSLIRSSAGVPWQTLYVPGEALTAVAIVASSVSSTISAIFLSSLKSHIDASVEENLTTSSFEGADAHLKHVAAPVIIDPPISMNGDVIAVLDSPPGPTAFFELCLPPKQQRSTIPPALVSGIEDDRMIGVLSFSGSGASSSDLHRVKMGDLLNLRCQSFIPGFHVAVTLSSDHGPSHPPVSTGMEKEPAEDNPNRKRPRDEH